MTFVCEWCAEGLTPDEIDELATYPDDQRSGEDDKGNPLCPRCAAAAKFEGRPGELPF